MASRMAEVALDGIVQRKGIHFLSPAVSSSTLDFISFSISPEIVSSLRTQRALNFKNNSLFTSIVVVTVSGSTSCSGISLLLGTCFLNVLLFSCKNVKICYFWVF